jgi:NAD(P)H-flavin reductase
MKETEAIIERVKRVNDTHQHVILAVDASLNGLLPGQSVLARVVGNDRYDPYLREQWFPVSAGAGKLTVERPASIQYAPGQVVSLLGSVGQPFRFRKTLRSVLLIAYETDPTPLLTTLAALLSNRVAVTLVLLGKAAKYGAAHLPPEIEVQLGSDDLNWQNRVTTVGWADQVFVAVSPDNQLTQFRAVWDMMQQLRADIPKNFLFGVFTAPLPCGVGACSACMLRMKSGTSMICLDGPAFDLTEVTLP